MIKIFKYNTKPVLKFYSLFRKTFLKQFKMLPILLTMAFLAYFESIFSTNYIFFSTREKLAINYYGICVKQKSNSTAKVCFKRKGPGSGA